jgi:hypothetical protein
MPSFIKIWKYQYMKTDILGTRAHEGYVNFIHERVLKVNWILPQMIMVQK